jgi:transcriptional regulator with XRE-family HTH domain
MAEELVVEENDIETLVGLVPDLATNIGARLKVIRERNGLSQRELAKRAGITNSNISMIEQGLVSPSINSLAKVLNGLPMSLTQFFSCSQVDIGQVVYTAEQLEAEQVSASSGIINQTIAQEKARRCVDLIRQIFPAGSDTGSEPLRSKTEISAQVINGSIELTAGIEIFQLKEGDAFYLAAMQPYRIRNRSEAAVVVMFASAVE